ncbi:hypothetical protein Cni_G10568 [Canna indica]|uniref:BZIP domain-containing protein n=1 Tax=Canna indica TaxID=4628 RepID=A0AAQ3Q7F7_9LILI|nr:hypothetical protein Cni_G10568 [Canna indica]
MRIQRTAAEIDGADQPLPEVYGLASGDSIYGFHQGNPSRRSMEVHGGGSSSQHYRGLSRGHEAIALPRAPSKKTVDEVWRDIQQGKKKMMNRELQSFDEMTLEDFLVKAGVAAECSDSTRIDRVGSVGFRPYMHWLQQQQQHPLVVDVMYNENQGNASSTSTISPGRKRAAAEDISEKTAERRKKRMIKNRESAARSRARKQAYTNELENKISLLEEENERLKKEKELESVTHVHQPDPKSQLRRTRSAPF